MGPVHALLGDSLDMLGDALVYGFSLQVLHRSEVWHVRTAVAGSQLRPTLELSGTRAPGRKARMIRLP